MSVTTTTAKIARPTGSSESRSPEGRLTSGRTRTMTAMTITPSGTFIPKIHRHPSVSPPSAITSPPSVGPSAVDSPTIAPKMPNARARSVPVKSCWIVPMTCGICTPAATPCRKRATTSTQMFGASAPRPLASVKPASPPIMSVRRDRWSPMRPAGTSTSPNARM